MSRYRDEVAAALAAVTIRAPARYAWLGRMSRPLPARLAAELNAAERRSYLVSCLREELYFSFYCHGRPVEARWGEPQPPFPDAWLTGVLSRANASRGSWEPGWTVERIESEIAVVADGRLRTRVALDDCRGALDVGASVEVRLPKELPEASPGYFTVLGDTAGPAGPTSQVRVYWHVTRSGAAPLVAALTGRLNAEEVPFQLKVANHPSRLRRCDAAVLYVPGDAFDASTLRAIATAQGRHLQPQVPAFTLELAPGVGLAEENGNAESFGVRRCALLAEAIVRAAEHGLTDPGARLEAVSARFAEDGVDIDAPYLEPSLAGRHVL